MQERTNNKLDPYTSSTLGLDSGHTGVRPNQVAASVFVFSFFNFFFSVSPFVVEMVVVVCLCYY